MTARWPPAAPAALLLLGACTAPGPVDGAPANGAGVHDEGWFEAFDGRSLGAFAITDFGGQGRVEVHDGRLWLGPGSPLTGVTWTGPAPHGEYELEVVAARERGSDFFCGLTFPVGSAWLTLVLGGWGGSVCGLSSLDGRDAANNATRTLRQFVSGDEHRVRVQVRATRVVATLDGQPLCAIDPRVHELGLRPEVTLSRPLGIAAYATSATVRAVRWRPLANGR